MDKIDSLEEKQSNKNIARFYYGLASSFFYLFLLLSFFIGTYIVPLMMFQLVLLAVGWFSFLIALGYLIYIKRYKQFLLSILVFVITIDGLFLFMGDFSHSIYSAMLFFLIFNTVIPILSILIYNYSKKGKTAYF